VTHERPRRGVMFGVDPELADGAGPAGGGRIDAAAGEVDSGARLAACRWRGPGACEKASKYPEGWRDARPPGGVRPA
jgi:hypothetical protein